MPDLDSRIRHELDGIRADTPDEHETTHELARALSAVVDELAELEGEWGWAINHGEHVKDTRRRIARELGIEEETA